MAKMNRRCAARSASARPPAGAAARGGRVAAPASIQRTEDRPIAQGGGPSSNEAGDHDGARLNRRERSDCASGGIAPRPARKERTAQARGRRRRRPEPSAAASAARATRLHRRPRPLGRRALVPAHPRLRARAGLLEAGGIPGRLAAAVDEECLNMERILVHIFLGRNFYDESSPVGFRPCPSATASTRSSSSGGASGPSSTTRRSAWWGASRGSPASSRRGWSPSTASTASSPAGTTCSPRCAAPGRRTSCARRDFTGSLMLTSSGTTKRLDRLERAGLIARAPDPDDRRGVLITLTGERPRADRPRHRGPPGQRGAPARGTRRRRSASGSPACCASSRSRCRRIT